MESAATANLPSASRSTFSVVVSTSCSIVVKIETEPVDAARDGDVAKAAVK